MNEMCLSVHCPDYTRCKLSQKPLRGKYTATHFIALEGNMECTEFTEMRRRDDGQ